MEAPEVLKANYRFQISVYAWAIQKLKPQARNRLEAMILHFSPGGLNEVPMELPPFEELEAEIFKIARSIRGLTSVEAAPALPGKRCRYCVFKEVCSEGKIFLKNQS